MSSFQTPPHHALAEIFDGTPLGERVLSYKIWLENGLIVHASDPALIGQSFTPSDELRRAWTGLVAATFEDLNDPENEAEAAIGVPLLEVDSAIRQVWTGKVIAVAEFYEAAEPLDADIHSARLTGWMVVGGAFLSSGLLLFGVVQAGGRTIRRQRKAFGAQQALGQDAHLVREALDKALRELRILSRGLALPDLDGLNLCALITREVDDHQKQTGLRVRIILADDHPIFRDGLLHSIEETGAFEVVGVGNCADGAVALALAHKPHVALLSQETAFVRRSGLPRLASPRWPYAFGA